MTGRMKNPPHPGEFFRAEVLTALGLSVSAGADVLGVSRSALSVFVKGKGRVTPELAVRLSKAFDIPADLWIRMQHGHDLGALPKLKPHRSPQGPPNAQGGLCEA